MTDRPILATPSGVRNILSGLQTQDRRPAWQYRDVIVTDAELARLKKREWEAVDGAPEDGDWTHPKPSLRMPRWASRLTLIVESNRIERLQDISEEDARAEGICFDHSRDPFASGPAACWWASAIHNRRGWNSARAAFQELWDSLYGSRPGQSWADNPEVCAISYRVVRANIDRMEGSDE